MLCLTLFALRVSGRSIKVWYTLSSRLSQPAPSCPCPVSLKIAPLGYSDVMQYVSCNSSHTHSYWFTTGYSYFTMSQLKKQRHLQTVCVILQWINSVSFHFIFPNCLPKQITEQEIWISAPFVKMTTCAVLIMLSDFQTPNSLRTFLFSFFFFKVISYRNSLFCLLLFLSLTFQVLVIVSAF